jgi:hypothetical protein
LKSIGLSRASVTSGDTILIFQAATLVDPLPFASSNPAQFFSQITKDRNRSYTALRHVMREPWSHQPGYARHARKLIEPTVHSQQKISIVSPEFRTGIPQKSTCLST